MSGLNTPGNYVFVLTVGDEEGESSRDDVTIIVNEGRSREQVEQSEIVFQARIKQSPVRIHLCKCFKFDLKKIIMLVWILKLLKYVSNYVFQQT